MPSKSKTSISDLGNALQRAADNKQYIQDVLPETPEPAKLGRKKRTSVMRHNAKTIYLTDEMSETLDEIKYNNRVGLQQIVQAGVYLLLKRYYDTENKQLNEDGMALVREYEASIEV